MTRERAQQLIANFEYLKAYAEGKTITDATGSEVPSPDFNVTLSLPFYRIKPTPTLRPWTPAEVPVGAITRLKGDPHKGCKGLIVSVYFCSSEVQTANRTNTLKEMLLDYEHSTDNGLTWHPCGVKENLL